MKLKDDKRSASFRKIGVDKIMKNKYFVTVTTMYDGFEWVQKDILEAKNEEEVKKIIYQNGYFTHDNGCEKVVNYYIEKLTQKQYIALCKFV